MKDHSIELKAVAYEMFIRHAHQCTRQLRYGADAVLLINLYKKEISDPAARRLPPYDKQLENIKRYIDKAFAIYQKTIAQDSAITQLSALRIRLSDAHSTEGIIQIIDEGFELINSLRDS